MVNSTEVNVSNDVPKEEIFKKYLRNLILRDREAKKQELEADRELLRIKHQRNKQRKKELNELSNVKQQLIKQNNIFQTLQTQKVRVFDHLKCLIHDSNAVVDITDLAKLYELGLAVTCPDPNVTTEYTTVQTNSYVSRPVTTTTAHYRVPLTQPVTLTTGKRARSPSPPVHRSNYTVRQGPGPHAFQIVEDSRHDYGRYLWNKSSSQGIGYGSFYPPPQPSATYTVSALPVHPPVAYTYSPLNRDPHETIHKPQVTNQTHVYRSAVPPQSGIPQANHIPYITVEHAKQTPHTYPDDKFYITVRPSNIPMHGGSIPIQQQPQGTKVGSITSGYPVKPSNSSMQIPPTGPLPSQHSQSASSHQPPPHIQIQSQQPRLVQSQQPLQPSQYQQPMHHIASHHVQQPFHMQTQHPSSSQSAQQSQSPHMSSHHHPHFSQSQQQHQSQSQTQHMLQSQAHGHGSASHFVHRASTQSHQSSAQHTPHTTSQHQQAQQSGQYQHMQSHHPQQNQSHMIPPHHHSSHSASQQSHMRNTAQHMQIRPQSVVSQHPISHSLQSISQQPHSYSMQSHQKLSNNHIQQSHHSLPQTSHAKIVQSQHVPSQHHQQQSYQSTAQSSQHPQSQSYQSSQQTPQSSQQSQTILQIHHHNLQSQQQQQQSSHYSEHQQRQQTPPQRQSPSITPQAVATQSSVIRNFSIQ